MHANAGRERDGESACLSLPLARKHRCAVEFGKSFGRERIERARSPLDLALQQSRYPMRLERLGVNGAKLGHGLVVSANNDDFTQFHLFDVAGEMRLSFLDVDLDHMPTSLSREMGPVV
jgi:hypothetical protein